MTASRWWASGPVVVGVLGLLVSASAFSCGRAAVTGLRADAGGGSGGNDAGGTGTPDSDGAAEDGPTGDATFAEDFAARVRAVLAQGGTAGTCASALPAAAASGTDDARAVVRTFVAGVIRVAPGNLTLHPVECGTATTTSCASRFMHDLYKSNGSYGASLYPLAQELEARGTSVEETIWTPEVNGITGASDVCFSGVVDGLLVGVCLFNDQTVCP